MTDARSDWETRIGRRSGEVDHGEEVTLPAPQRSRASGRGQVTLSWDPVEGAAGYLGPCGAGAGRPV